MMSVDAFAKEYIFLWEDGGSSDPRRTLSLDAEDAGNWTGGACGVGACCGSHHGVTAAALAQFRNCAPAAITRDVMAALTISEAAQIAVALYYDQPGLRALPWDQVMASVMDFGWGAGPHEAALILQRLVGVPADGRIGPRTVQAYQAWIAHAGIAQAARLWAAARDDFYAAVVRRRPVTAKYLKGWQRRTAYYLPGGPWWQRCLAAS